MSQPDRLFQQICRQRHFVGYQWIEFDKDAWVCVFSKPHGARKVFWLTGLELVENIISRRRMKRLINAKFKVARLVDVN